MTVYELNVSVGDVNFDEVNDEVSNVVGGLLEQAQGSMTAGPTETSVAGLRALSVEGSSLNPQACARRAG